MLQPFKKIIFIYFIENRIKYKTAFPPFSYVFPYQIRVSTFSRIPIRVSTFPVFRSAFQRIPVFGSALQRFRASALIDAEMATHKA